MHIYSEVFEDNLGTVKGISAKIYVESTAVPRFYKARFVLFVQRKKVEK